MTGQNLLQTRLRLLLRSVDEVDKVLDVMHASRGGLDGASQAIEASKFRIANLQVDVSVLDQLGRLRDSQPRNSASYLALEKVLTFIADAQELKTAAGEELRMALDALNNLSQRSAFPPDELQDEADLDKQVKTATKRCRTEIDKVQKGIAGQPDAKTLTAAWTAFAAKVQHPTEDLFSEYVDLLGGIAIRERGVKIGAGSNETYVDELCAMTDWHVRNELALLADGARAVTLPMQRDILTASSWPVLRLGFAQWSLWGMPLEAHQFGRLYAAARLFEEDQKWATTKSGDWALAVEVVGAEGLLTLMGDIFATIAIGPAYACALIFLRLDPAAGKRIAGGRRRGSELLDADRVDMVRQCLRAQIVTGDDTTPEKAALDEGYFEFLDPVFEEWRSASELLGGTATSDERLKTMSGITEKIVNWLDIRQVSGLGDWRVSTRAWSSLNNGELLEEPVGVKHLLNAAWYALAGTGVVEAERAADIERLLMAEGRALTIPGLDIRAAGDSRAAIAQHTDSAAGAAANQPSPTKPVGVLSAPYLTRSLTRGRDRA